MTAHRSSRSIRQCKGLRLADGARFYASGKAHEVEADDERITFPHTSTKSRTIPGYRADRW